ncbi:MAG TPA: hypothetical protein VIY49_34310 [Bryobacteraceae bacterium]
MAGSSSRPRLPAILLSQTALMLLRDVFGEKDLFRDMPRIPTRTVLWGQGSVAVVLPHSAIVVSEETLLSGLRPRRTRDEVGATPQWRVYSSPPLPPESTEQRFGSRMAQASLVELRSEEPGCWVESTEEGRLFLISSGAEAWLLSMGAPTVAQLEQSRLIAQQIERVGGHLGENRGEFPAYPRIASLLAGKCGADEPWLACGTGRLGVRPDLRRRAAHALREAILAAAVIRAIAAGANADQALAHYESRLTAGFQRHLAQCASFYGTGGRNRWWSGELEALERGIGWCAKRMSKFPAFRHRLNGYELEATPDS